MTAERGLQDEHAWPCIRQLACEQTNMTIRLRSTDYVREGELARRVSGIQIQTALRCRGWGAYTKGQALAHTHSRRLKHPLDPANARGASLEEHQEGRSFEDTRMRILPFCGWLTPLGWTWDFSQLLKSPETWVARSSESP